MAGPVPNIFDNDHIKESYSGTVEIENIYTTKYEQGRDKLLRQNMLEKTIFNWMVKGKTAGNTLKAKLASYPGRRTVKVHGVWEIVVDTTEKPDELTLRRLVACMAYDNAFKGTGAGTLDLPKREEGFKEESGNLKKFHTAMSTLIDWDRVSESVRDPHLKVVITKYLPALFTPGLHFVFRIWLSKAGAATDIVQMATAFQIAAHCSDLCRHTTIVRQAKIENKVTIKHSLMMATKERGTITSLMINVDGRPGEESKPLNDLVDKDELKRFADSGICCIQPQKSKEAVVGAIKLMLGDDKEVEGVDAMLALVGQNAK